VDEGLAIEAELLALRARMREAIVVGEIEMHTVEDREAEGARDKQAKLEARQHRQALARMCCVKVVGEIRSTYHQTLDTPGACGNFFGVEYAKRSLNHAPDRQRSGRGSGGEALFGLVHHLRALNLRDEDRVCCRLGHHGEIVDAPRRVKPINAHDELAPPISTL